MGATDFEARRVGDEFTYVWHEFGFAIGFDQLRQERWGLSGEIHVQTATRLESTGRPGHVFQGIYNLSKLDDRDKLVKSLQTRNDRVPWVDLLEVARVETTRLFRQGEPAVSLSRVEYRPQSFAVDRMFPTGESSVIFGDGASTKSFMGVALALAVATGRQVGPFRPVERRDVLVLDYETTVDEWAERLTRVSRGAGLVTVPEAVHYRKQVRPLTDDIEQVRGELTRVGATFVVVDSIALACGGEVNSDNVIPFFNTLRSLEDTTRVVLSHVSKDVSRQDRGVGDPYGSIFVKNFSRSVWGLRRDEGDDGVDFEVTLIHRKVNRGPLQKPIGVRFRFDDPAGPITLEEVDPMANPVLSQHGGLSDRMAFALKRGGMSTKEMADELGADEKVISVTARRMEKGGRLVRLDGDARRGRGNVAIYGLVALPSRNGSSHP